MASGYCTDSPRRRDDDYGDADKNVIICHGPNAVLREQG